jgi:hypothetical protein
MKKILAVLSLLILACSTAPTDPTGASPLEHQAQAAPSDYKSVIERWTRHDQGYLDFAQSFQAAATLLSRAVTEKQVNLNAENLNWTPEQKQDARQRALYDLQGQTTFLLSLYTDKDEDNNLDKSNSIWNLILEVNGKRLYPQSIKRVYENRAVLLQKYPYINVWSRNYLVKFPINTDEATSSGAQFIVTGPIGKADLKF